MEKTRKENANICLSHSSSYIDATFVETAMNRHVIVEIWHSENMMRNVNPWNKERLEGCF